MSQDTTIVVQFGTGTADAAAAGAHLSAEIDRRENGLNGGKTSFAPGDTVHFLVYKSSNVTLENPVASAGSVAFTGSTNVEQTQDLIFANSNEARLRVPPVGGVTSTQWLGNNLGGITINGTQATAANKGVGVARVTYTATATTGTITSPGTLDGLNDFSIVVLIVGNVT